MSNERRSDKFRARAQETTRIPGKFPQQKYHRILKVRLSKEKRISNKEIHTEYINKVSC